MNGYRVDGWVARVDGWMGRLQKLKTVWVGGIETYKGGVRTNLIIYQIWIKTMSV